MAELKTQKTEQKAEDYLNAISDEKKRLDGFKLLEIFKNVTNEPAVMWGTSIVGFGQYHYKSERSSQEGDWPLVGFSVRKQNLTLYLMPSLNYGQNLFDQLGKHKTSVGCVYINKLEDVDIPTLEKIIEKALVAMKKVNKVE